MRKMSLKTASLVLNNVIATAEADCDSGDPKLAASARVTHSLGVVLLHVLSCVPEDEFKKISLLTDAKTHKLEDDFEGE